MRGELRRGCTTNTWTKNAKNKYTSQKPSYRRNSRDSRGESCVTAGKQHSEGPGSEYKKKKKNRPICTQNKNIHPELVQHTII